MAVIRATITLNLLRQAGVPPPPAPDAFAQVWATLQQVFIDEGWEVKEHHTNIMDNAGEARLVILRKVPPAIPSTARLLHILNEFGKTLRSIGG